MTNRLNDRSRKTRRTLLPVCGLPHRNLIAELSCRALTRTPLRSSRHQPLVGQPPIGDATNKTLKAFRGVPANVAVIQPERKLVDVPAYMVWADVVEGSVDTALQDRPDGFDAVNVNVAINVQPDVLSIGMVDRLVTEEEAVRPRIGKRFVRVDRGTGLHSRINHAAKRRLLRITNRQQDRFPVPLAQSHDRSLTDSATARVQLFPFVFIAFLPADVRLVNFNRAGKYRLIIAAGFADSVHHEPRRLLGNADLLRHLKRRDRLSGRDHQIHSVDPFVQGDVAALKNGAGPDGEVFIAGVAAIEASLARADTLAGIADGANGTIRPQARLQIEPRRFRVWKHLKDLESTYRAFTHDYSLLNGMSWGRTVDG